MRVLACVVLLILSAGCTVNTLHNQELWYRISVPKTWKTQGTAMLSGQGDSLQVTRIRDDSSLEAFVQSQRQAFQIEKADFVTEDEAWLTIHNRKAWRMVGTDKAGGKDEVWILVFVDVGQYKYRLWFKTPNDTFRQREKGLNEILRTFVVKIPEY